MLWRDEMVNAHKDLEEMDIGDIIALLKEARKHKLHSPPFKISSKHNVKVYLDIVIFLKFLQKVPIEALELIDTYTGLPANEIIEYLFEDGFISYDLNDKTAEYFFNLMTVPDLKKILKDHDLKSSGKKEELIHRIRNNLPFKYFLFSELLLTNKGLEFFDEWSWLIDYNRILRNFDLQDFFCYQFEREGEIKDISIAYLDEHLDIAVKKGDIEYISHCLLAKSDVYKIYKVWENYLDCHMRMFNLIFIYSDIFASTSFRKYSDEVKEIRNLTKLFDEEAIYDSFERNWNFLHRGDLRINKRNAKVILEKILSRMTVDDLRKFVKKNYYYKEDSYKKILKNQDESNGNQSSLDSFF